MNHYDVVIIGAGPTGLMAANQLARFNIDFLIIDSKEGPTEQSRAIVITARSMEIYEQMGISDVPVKEGRYISEFAIFVKGKQRAMATIGEFGKGLTDFSYLLSFEQSRNEQLLNSNLASFKKKVSWQTELHQVVDQPGMVELYLKRSAEPGQPVEKITARYVIGCDGAGSRTRHQLNFSFKGGTYEQRFYVADTKLKWQEGFNKLILFPGRKNFCGFFPMGGPNSHRIVGTIPGSFTDDREITFNDLEKTIKETVRFPFEFEKVTWFSVYKLHHRSVETFRKGNCFLAGDAAHIHSPAGGQGMNTGLQDAYNLSWKLALVVKGIAGEKLLDTYNEERLPFAKWLLGFTDRFFGLMTSRNIIISWLRNNIAPYLLKFFLGIPVLRPVIFKTLSQTRWSYTGCSIAVNRSLQKLKFKAGDRLPYLLVNKECIYRLLTEPVFHLLIIGGVTISLHLPSFIKRVDLGIEEWKPLGVRKTLFILVRPDNYIGLIADEMNEEIMSRYLEGHCCFLNKI